MDDRTNSEREYWERRAEAWDRRVGVLERFTEAFGHAAMDAVGGLQGRRVLDVGCGPGSTTLDLGGRVGPDGVVVGLDISPAMVAAGERRASSSGVDHVHFVVHDLQAGPLPEAFDVGFSRFGVMFFSRPAVAFTNLVASLAPGGRFGCAVWAPIDQNPWMLLPTFAAAGPLGAALDPPGPDEPGPFSLADSGSLVSLLETAGLVDVEVTECRGRLEVPTVSAEAEIASMLEIGPLGDAFTAAPAGTRAEAIAAVVSAIEPFRTIDGWDLPGCSLIASGHRPD